MSVTQSQTESFDQWVNRIAEVKPWIPGEGQEPIDMYVSRIDGGYLCFGNLLEDIRWLYDRGITEEIQKKDPDGNVCCIGFNPENQKWYGWSHRAFAGFGAGDVVTKLSSGYQPTDADDLLAQAIRFWESDTHLEVAGIKDVTNERGEQGVQITYVISDTVPNESMRGQVQEQFMPYPKQWGRGEWTAQTLDDAKQMAIDFAESVG